MRSVLTVAGLLLASVDARATDICQDLIKGKQLPMDFEVVSRSKLGPAELVILSNGKCTCNDLPAVQRSIGQPQPDNVFWACEADDPKAN